MLQREGFARFPVVGLGEDPGLFLPVALSGKFYVCSTTDCSYCVSSAGSIQCSVKGSPTVDQGLHQRKLVVLQVSGDTDHSLEFVKKINICMKLVVGVFDPWLTLLADSKSYRMWLPDTCRYQDHRPLMIYILPNISGTFVDVWFISCLDF
jgi:hypothetical protein